MFSDDAHSIRPGGGSARTALPHFVFTPSGISPAMANHPHDPGHGEGNPSSAQAWPPQRGEGVSDGSRHRAIQDVDKIARTTRLCWSLTGLMVYVNLAESS